MKCARSHNEARFTEYDKIRISNKSKVSNRHIRKFEIKICFINFPKIWYKSHHLLVTHRKLIANASNSDTNKVSSTQKLGDRRIAFTIKPINNLSLLFSDLIVCPSADSIKTELKKNRLLSLWHPFMVMRRWFSKWSRRFVAMGINSIGRRGRSYCSPLTFRLSIWIP